MTFFTIDNNPYVMGYYINAVIIIYCVEFFMKTQIKIKKLILVLFGLKILLLEAK